MLKEEARLKEELKALMARAGAVDAEEDERYGEEVRGDELTRGAATQREATGGD